MKLHYLSRKLLLVFSFFFTVLLSHSEVSAQVKQAVKNPLTLVQLKALLQADNGKTIGEKNSDAIVEVSKHGLSFPLTLDLEQEIIAVGANEALIKTIRIGALLNKVAKPEDTTKPSFKIGYIWAESNVTHEGQKGMFIHATFTAKNLKSVPCAILHTFKTDKSSDYGEISVKGITNKYKALNSDLRPKTNFTPTSDSLVYKKLTTFVPYSEFKLKKPSLYSLHLSSRITSGEGKTTSNFKPQLLIVNLPQDTSKLNTAVTEKPSIQTDKTWFDLDVTQGSEKGIYIHSSFTAKNLAGIKCTLFHHIKDGADAVKTMNRKYSFMGNLVPSVSFTPKTNSVTYKKITTFVPYSAFALEKPKIHMLVTVPKVLIAGGADLGDLTPKASLIKLPKDQDIPKLKGKKEVSIDKIWSELDITEKGVKGMRVHVKISTKNLKGKALLLQTFFSNKDGPLKAKTDLFSTQAGNTSLNRKLTPKFDESLYEDIVMFIPYDEFSLGYGGHVITLETKVSTFKESTQLCAPKKTAFIYNKKLE